MTNRFYAVTVICNRDIYDSASYNSLKKSDGVRIIVCDNRTEKNDNGKCADSRVSYIPMGKNAGLAAAYNRALDSLNTDDGYICLFDDDTEIPDNYFTEIDRLAVETDADVILPVVKDETGIMSPCRINGVLTSRISSPDEINGRNISGINSGMAVKAAVFKNYRYDTEYFLDFIDHAFIRDMKNAGKKICVCDSVCLRQSFSANDRNIERAKRRYEIFRKDYLRFCSQSGSKADIIKGKLYLLKRSFNINVLYRLKK